MNLEELLLNTKSNKVFLIDKNCKVIDSYSKDDTTDKILEDRIIAFSGTISNMINHFFEDFLKSGLKSVVMKSNKENIVLVKLEELILCFFSDKNINLALLGVSVQREINKK
ncbi:hypothetical protein [uncultured Tenacibaculum sp.]|uniref:hypothetical protein n=1 Tax=uncultured Tenacibaculum sp. TaxID=174713 RepID=UPI002611BB2D|nr:hypothetical protein [uncultured Tenacibaculum sp.]